jgi:hypothetical protein
LLPESGNRQVLQGPLVPFCLRCARPTEHRFLQTTGRIKVWNNGSGVPVEMHKKENVYVPELIFGHLLTSSNYEDDQKKV